MTILHGKGKKKKSIRALCSPFFHLVPQEILQTLIAVASEHVCGLRWAKQTTVSFRNTQNVNGPMTPWLCLPADKYKLQRDIYTPLWVQSVAINPHLSCTRARHTEAAQCCSSSLPLQAGAAEGGAAGGSFHSACTHHPLPQPARWGLVARRLETKWLHSIGLLGKKLWRRITRPES